MSRQFSTTFQNQWSLPASSLSTDYQLIITDQLRGGFKSRTKNWVIFLMKVREENKQSPSDRK